MITREAYLQKLIDFKGHQGHNWDTQMRKIGFIATIS